MNSIVRPVLRNPGRSPGRSVLRGAPPLFLNQAIVLLDESGIVGSAPVTSWTNSGTGGSGFDLDVVIGTAANLTAIQELGHTVVSSSGAVGLQPTASQVISSGATVFSVFRYSDPTPATFQNMFDARVASGRWLGETLSNDNDNFAFFQGSAELAITGTYDALPHRHTFQFNGDATSKYTVSGIGSRTGNAGSSNWNFMTLFARNDGGTPAAGYCATFIVFDFKLDKIQIEEMDGWLALEYPIP